MSLRGAIAAGLAGSFAMDVVQDAFARTFERGRDNDDRDEETEAIVSVVRRIVPLVPFAATPEGAGWTGRAVHYIFGCGFALAYDRLRRRLPSAGAFGGLPFGLMLWLVSDVVLIPAAHLGRPLFRYSRAERLNAIASHIAYAATVDAVLRRRLGSR